MDTATLIVCLVYVLGSPLHPAASHPEKSHPILGNIAVPGGKTQLILSRESNRMSAVEFQIQQEVCIFQKKELQYLTPHCYRLLV